MKNTLTTLLAICAGATVAHASPHESFNIITANGGPMFAVGTHNNTSNGLAGFTAVGADAGGPYTARSIRLTGTISTWGGGTYGGEAIIEVAGPGGQVYYFQPFLGCEGTPSGARSFSLQWNIPAGSPAGNWQVQVFELYDDLGTDAVYSALNVTFDDGVSSPPATVTDLGDLSAGTHSVDVPIINTTPNQVQWIKATLPPVGGTNNGYVDIWDSPSGLAGWTTTNTMSFVVVGIYNDQGKLLAYDDGNAGLYQVNATGTALTSAHGLFTFGSTVSRGPVTYPGLHNSNERDGSTGSLAGGVYYIGVIRQQNTGCAMPAPGYNASTTYGGAQLRTMLHINTQENTTPTPPVIIPGPLDAAAAGSNVTITCSILPGAHPESSNVVVTADLASLGGANGVVMTGPDDLGNYTATATIPAGDTDFAQPHAVTLYAHDAQGRNAANVTVNVKGLGPVSWDETINGLADAAKLPATAQTPAGSGALTAVTGVLNPGDVDMYRITICNGDIFEVTTRFGPGTPDTQLFLFRADGRGHAFNDDNFAGMVPRIDPPSSNGPLSSTININNGLTYPAGDYYLAVSAYDNDPRNAVGQYIWLDSGFGRFDIIMSANGTVDGTITGAQITDYNVASWDSNPVPAVPQNYRISLKGACFAFPAPCSPADLGRQGGYPGPDHLLDNNDFIAFISHFFANDPHADMGIQGGFPGQDGQFDNNDFIAFINEFFAGC